MLDLYLSKKGIFMFLHENWKSKQNNQVDLDTGCYSHVQPFSSYLIDLLYFFK